VPVSIGSELSSSDASSEERKKHEISKKHTEHSKREISQISQICEICEISESSEISERSEGSPSAEGNAWDGSEIGMGTNQLERHYMHAFGYWFGRPRRVAQPEQGPASVSPVIWLPPWARGSGLRRAGWDPLAESSSHSVPPSGPSVMALSAAITVPPRQLVFCSVSRVVPLMPFLAWHRPIFARGHSEILA